MKELETVITSLKTLATDILALTTEDRSPNELYGGWNYSVLNRHNLASIASNLAYELESIKPPKQEEAYKKLFIEIDSKIQRFKVSGSLTQLLSGGNSLQAIPIYLGMMEWIVYSLQPITGWQIVSENKYTPKYVVNRVKALNSELDNIQTSYKEFKEKIEAIESAHTMLEELPIGLQRVNEIIKEAETLEKQYAVKFSNMETALKEAKNSLEKIQGNEGETDKLVSKCNQAYMATTSAGLAGAFTKRALGLNWSIRLWTLGLLVSLVAGAYIGTERIKILSEALSKSTPDWGIIMIHLVLSVLGVAFPLWFAWLATKQIGQRFKLAEDYSFKAAVAQAYEGYRQEAIRVDKELETRLFGSALTRLEELPLRLLDDENHGSPYSEAVNSKLVAEISDGVRNVISKVLPEKKPDGTKA